MGRGSMRELKNNGFIFPIANWLIINSSCVSLVEGFKSFAGLIARIMKADERKFKNYAIDLFIALKWVVVVLAIKFTWDHSIVVYSVLYLLVMNLHSYMLHHIWSRDNNIGRPMTAERERRRFISLLLAIAYSEVCYTYLYLVPLHHGFSWPNETSNLVASFVFSAGNSLTGFSGNLKPIATSAHLAATSQLIMSVIFIAIVLSQSIPKIESK